MSAGDMPAGENAAVLFVDDEAGVLTGRRRFPVAGRILLTGFTGSGLQEEVMGKGLARRILLKPWDNKEFLAVLHSTLQQVGR